MSITQAFSQGYEDFKENFWPLTLLNLSRLAIPLGIILVAALLLAPVLISPTLFQAGGYAVAVGLPLAVVFLAAMPFFAFPVLSGAIIKKKNLKPAFMKIAENYKEIFVDMTLVASLGLFLLLETAALWMVFPLLGLASTLITFYVLLRVSFWDILLLKGEEHPIKASWELTKDKVLSVVAFTLVSSIIGYVVGLVSIIPLGFLVTLATAPFFVTSRVAFVEIIKEGSP